MNVFSHLPLKFTALIFVIISTISFSTFSQVNITDHVVYRHGKPTKIEGVNHLVSDYYNHTQSGLKVYSLRNTYQPKDYPPLPNYCDLDVPYPFVMTVIKDGKNIWQKKGIFEEPVFSANGKSVLITARYDHVIVETTVIDEKVVHHINKIDSTFEDEEQHKNKFTSEHTCPREYHQNYTEISDDGKQQLEYIEDDGNRHINLCSIGVKGTCTEISTKNYDDFYPVDLALGETNQVYLLSNTQLLRLDNNLPLWRAPLVNFNEHESAQLSLYKNLVLVTNKDNVQLYDKENGQLLYQRSRCKQLTFFRSFNHVYIRDGYLIFQIKSKGEYGRVNIREYLNN